jgi:hypothetical protein
VTTIEFERSNKEVNLTLLFRTPEHGFLASEFHQYCDWKGPTITLVKAENGLIAAAYSGVEHGPFRNLNTRGFLASIVDESGVTGDYSLHKYAANKHAYTLSFPRWGPHFEGSLLIADRCDVNERSSSYLGSGYGSEEVDPFMLFGSFHFRVLEYEVYQVEGFRDV